jgi:hypothetical protein
MFSIDLCPMSQPEVAAVIERESISAVEKARFIGENALERRSPSLSDLRLRRRKIQLLLRVNKVGILVASAEAGVGYLTCRWRPGTIPTTREQNTMIEQEILCAAKF